MWFPASKSLALHKQDILSIHFIHDINYLEIYILQFSSDTIYTSKRAISSAAQKKKKKKKKKRYQTVSLLKKVGTYIGLVGLLCF